MSKDTFYFSHDSNARQDPKILQMRSVYGYEGYGWYWALVEVMREQNEYKLSIQGQYVWNAFALLLQCDEDTAQKYIKDCVDEFKLFESDGEYIWSASLRRRMGKMEERSEKARQAALSRWKKKSNADAMQTHSERNANKIKENKINIKDPPLTPPGETTPKDIPKDGLSITERECLRLLKSVDDYPFDFEKDLEHLRALAVDFPHVDMLNEIRKWQTYKLDQPLEKKSKPRLQLRNWFTNASKWSTHTADPAMVVDRNRSPAKISKSNAMKFEPWQLEMLEKKRREKRAKRA